MLFFFRIFNPCVLAVTRHLLELLFEQNGMFLLLVGIDLDNSFILVFVSSVCAVIFNHMYCLVLCV